MESRHPAGQTSAGTHPGLKAAQEVVVWPDPVSTVNQARPTISRIYEVDDETGRLVVQISTPPGEQAIERGVRLVVLAALPGSGLYYRHFEVDGRVVVSEAPSVKDALQIAAVDEWRRIERRQAERMHVSIAVAEVARAPASGGLWKIAGTIRNISASGLLLEANQRLEPNDQLQLEIPLFDGKPPLRAKAQVVRVVASPANTGTWFAGCRFEALQAVDRLRLNSALPRLPAGSPFIS
jgi:PilZ domain-containing protein